MQNDSYKERLRAKANEFMSEEYPAPMFTDVQAVSGAKDFCSGADWSRKQTLEEVQFLVDALKQYENICQSGSGTEEEATVVFKDIERELDSAKAIINRQAELISYLIKDKNLAEIKARFDAEIADKEMKNS